MELKNKKLLQTGIFIDNKFTKSTDNSTFKVNNPANGKLVCTVANATEIDTNKAIHSAETAFKKWSTTNVLERSKILKKWYQLIIDNKDDLALLLTTEQGKPLNEALGEINYGASFVEWYAEECRRTYGETIPFSNNSKRLKTIQQPIGVVAAITPWNFPTAMITRKVAPAIAAGCTVVLKPAEDTPLSALALAQLALEAGLPKGVLSILPTTNYKDIGRILTTHPSIAKVSFTGSTTVGKLLMQQSASTLKKLSLELGGNAPCIIFDDAELDNAVKGAIATKYRNAGQTCVCANRILVQKSIYPTFLKKYTEAVEKLKVGNGIKKNSTIGPLINQEAIDKIKNLLTDALENGAKITLGGNQHKAGKLFFEPTIITNCTNEMQLSKEEIFGPVSSIFIFETEEEAIAMANDTEYGLAAYFFSENVNRVIRVSEKLEYGIIGINEGIISTAEAPFGGIKQSGFGKEGSFYGIEEYQITKYICIGNL
ncbi:MAG TPA: NAD-dependent succinate-semialdehyde dehydrogenase [Arachidicoccus soli]|uniref:Aldehyde dehydrogenase n=1 Tax=Arachidicoccus soli TaxID=2341117 RepID=A0A386HLN7_9BACT|nr:NAD-dependent succinate-semialdehyde dehydrogenase [Arachidicoccus soli]AYD46818.1 NAD-dependent succinate-semialdehyde dehydrogenase [Arachidicoccus soli]HEU0228362.1 NAD-dependent succinate-semialdehyde dehydrogenase [Arachidicoccus soli]